MSRRKAMNCQGLITCYQSEFFHCDILIALKRVTSLIVQIYGDFKSLVLYLKQNPQPQTIQFVREHLDIPIHSKHYK